jgi:hypothetical protein
MKDEETLRVVASFPVPPGYNVVDCCQSKDGERIETITLTPVLGYVVLQDEEGYFNQRPMTTDWNHFCLYKDLNNFDLPAVQAPDGRVWSSDGTLYGDVEAYLAECDREHRKQRATQKRVAENMPHFAETLRASSLRPLQTLQTATTVIWKSPAAAIAASFVWKRSRTISRNTRQTCSVI